MCSYTNKNKKVIVYPGIFKYSHLLANTSDNCIVFILRKKTKLQSFLNTIPWYLPSFSIHNIHAKALLCYVMTVGALRPVNFSNCEMLRAMSSKGFKTICRENKKAITLT